MTCLSFILRRSDGVFAYQLAEVADNGAMEVTQPLRTKKERPGTGPRRSLVS